MQRRQFLQTSALAGMGIAAGCADDTPKQHYITLSFDDGFKKSYIKVAELYEKYDLCACFNIIAGAHLPGFVGPDEYIAGYPLGNFTLWNELQDRGHEVMPHGYRHANLAKLPIAEATDLINRSLDMFSSKLKNFDPKRAIFNFPYNASSPELCEWLDDRVLAYTTSGDNINPLPQVGQKFLGRRGYGPDSSEPRLDAQIEDLLTRPTGWLVFNTHGLDGEGWGPIGSGYLDRLLARLIEIPTVKVIPAGVALQDVTPA